MPIARKKSLAVLPVEGPIRLVRGQKVMLDSDVARLYGVETKALNQAVRRNPSRFPPDFMFQLTAEEAESPRSQFVTSNESRGGRRYLPYAFTEHGVVMLSSVLRSERAAQMNIAVVRAFVRMREMILADKDLAARVEKLERGHVKTGDVIEILIEDIDRVTRDIRWIKNPPLPKKYPIGFRIEKDNRK
ncbi:MAG: ORF6N domain-containing protein [Alphaproteobacteria bacterium]|nr:ORF6N domain-containing protein [Alphaproteobacteria bacterium]